MITDSNLSLKQITKPTAHGIRKQSELVLNRNSRFFAVLLRGWIIDPIFKEKNECASALKKVKRLCKDFGFTTGMVKGSLAKGPGGK